MQDNIVKDKSIIIPYNPESNIINSINKYPTRKKNCRLNK